jgi:phosphoribosylformylglycinamidine cyclo-ligase
MPGFYGSGEYDIAGFCTAVVDKTKIFDTSSITEGDVLVALPSSGVHSNGFSLVRSIFDLDKHPENLGTSYPELGTTLGAALLEPTRIYVNEVLSLSGKVAIKGASHITGGGFLENNPRSLPDGLGARIEKQRVRIHPIFSLMQKLSSIDDRQMFNTFNMGVGMVLILDKDDAKQALSLLPDAYVLGSVVASDEALVLL